MRALKAKTPREAVFSAVTTPAHPLRILTAVPLCDGHDSAITTINIELVRAGIEVIYLGYNRSARDIARAAIQEDVQAIGISSYNGGHVEFFGRVAELLKSESAGGIGLFGGGGGTISAADAKNMLRHGVDRISFPAPRWKRLSRSFSALIEMKRRFGLITAAPITNWRAN